jgi:hypothetical protein
LLFWPILTICGSSLEGCVLPIGPDFTDPPPAIQIPELPPYFGDTKPPLETVVDLNALNASGTGSFDLAIADPNGGDTIWVRLVANYPPFSSESTKYLGKDSSMGSDGAPGTFHFLKKVVCADVPKAADRTLSVIVSDRDFLDPESAPDAVNKYSYYQDSSGAAKQTFVIGSWRITGCLP